ISRFGSDGSIYAPFFVQHFIDGRIGITSTVRSKKSLIFIRMKQKRNLRRENRVVGMFRLIKIFLRKCICQIKLRLIKIQSGLNFPFFINRNSDLSEKVIKEPILKGLGQLITLQTSISIVGFVEIFKSFSVVFV